MPGINTFKSFVTVCCLLFSGPALFAQWEEEEQAYVRSCAESLPLESISVFVNERLRRTYKYDFYKRYIGFENVHPANGVQETLTLSYDDFGFLEQEVQTVEQNTTTQTSTYQYKQLEALLLKEDCSRFELLDSISKQPTGKFDTRCKTTKTVFNAANLPTETYILYDSVFWLTEKKQYQAERHVETAHFHFTGDKSNQIYQTLFEYDKSGRKTAMYLQKGNVKKVKETWTYDAEGRLEAIKKFNTQYGPPREKVDNKIITTGVTTILGDEKVMVELRFKYDKKGRVSVLESYISDKLAQTLNFKYKSPKN